MSEIALAHIRELVHDQRHFTARWLRDLKAHSDIEPESVALIGAAIFGICLLQADQACFLSNGLLIFVPLILTYVYPKERPAIPLLLIYWACFSISTIFDDAFAAAFPIYYVLKTLAMGLLFLKPFCFAQTILEILEKNKLPTGADSGAAHEEHDPFNAEELRELEKAKHKKSPPPEKPEGENGATAMTPGDKSTKTIKTAQTQSERTNSVVGKKEADVTPAPTPPPTPTPKPVQDDSTRQTRNVQSLYLPASSEGGNAAIANALKPTVRTPRSSVSLPVQATPNPMLTDANYQLASSASNTSTDSVSIEGDKNPDDLVFIPSKKLVFNSPFDDHALTYHMTLTNNARKWIAYAIKSNAIPRVTANPPSGVLKPGEKHVVAVNILNFTYEDIDVSKDRIAFDYVFCPPNTKAFTHSLLQGQETRRRKNIKIEYNP